MKKLWISLFLIPFGINASYAGTDNSDSTGLAGDNLDLYAVLELFKKADSPEKFEELLNKEDSKVNNLDLNNDDEIDYIQVIDQVDSNFHAVTLRVAINDKESQDVAVIEIEQKDKSTAHLQIIGDEELYGKDFIIEPMEGNGDKEPSPIVVLVNVWAWPCVTHIYGPKYKIWVSPWHWRHYPKWWKPWRPLAWRVYHPHVVIHHHHYHRVNVIRAPRAHRVYHNHRVHSANVYHHRNANTAHPNKTNVKQQDKKANGNVGAKKKNNVQVNKKNNTRKKAAPRKK